MLLALSTMVFSNSTLFAQNDAQNFFNNATSTPDISRMCATCNSSTFALEGTLNADMIEKYPGAGTGKPGFEETFDAVVWSGVDGETTLLVPVYNQTGLWVQESSTNAYTVIDLPSANSIPANNGWTANDPDVVLGSYKDPNYAANGQMLYFVEVVYEAGGKIWTETWDVSFSGGAVTLTAPAGFSTASPCVHDVTDPNNGGVASHPNIDLIAETYGHTNLDMSTIHSAITYVYEDGITAVEQVYYAYGLIYGSSINTCYVADGTQPDIAACVPIVPAGNPINPPYDERQAFITYIAANGDLEVAEVGAETTFAVHTSYTLETGVDVAHPRIDAAKYYDFTLMSQPSQPYVVTAQVYDVNYSSNWRTKAYSIEDPNVTGTLYTTEVSDAGAPGPFNSDDCIYPVVTGVGEYLFQQYSTLGVGGNGYSEFVTMYYSDYTHLNNSQPNSANTNGDFFSNAVQISSPFNVLNVTPDEVNFEDLSIDFAYAVGTPPDPKLAMATSRNSGYDLLCVYWDGGHIRWKKTGNSTYAFKPTRTGIIGVESTGVNIYPNPATDMLNVSGADGKDYTILDITGKQVANGTFAGTKADVNISNLAAGSYIMHINTADGAEDLKFVKQ